MLTGIHVAFIGGDARQLEVIKRCIQLDAMVTLIGFDNLESNFTGATKRPLTCDVLKDADALILPIVGTDDSGYVESIFCSKQLKLQEEHVASLPKHCVVYTGMAKPYLRGLLEPKNIPLVELLDRDDVAIYNSIPTVEGALMMAIQNTDITVRTAWYWGWVAPGYPWLGPYMHLEPVLKLEQGVRNTWRAFMRWD